MTNHAIQRAYTGLVSRDQWATMREQAGILVQTGFLPQHIKNAEQAVAIMLKGYELGIPPMHALNNIAVIGGKPVANAELMLALIYRDHGDDAIRFQETEATHCTISYKRRAWTQRDTFTFSMDDARRAALSGTNWTKYPAAMLRARCISAVARLAFPDSIGGMYSPEEMGAAVEVNPETGEILTVQAIEIHDAGTPTAPEPAGRPQAVQAAPVGTTPATPAPAPALLAPAGQEPADDSPRIATALETDQQRVRAVLVQRKPGTNPTRADVTQEFITLIGADITYGNASAADWHALADALEAESPSEPDADAA